MNDNDPIVDPKHHTGPAIFERGDLLIRSLPPITDEPPEELPEGGKIIALVDCEATGLDPQTAKIIELAIQLVAVDANGQVIGHTAPASWLEDPQEPLTDEVRRITKLTDADLAGQAIDEHLAVGLLSRAHLIVAHNAAYDSVLIERRFPSLAGKAWACSVREVPWLFMGLDGKQMGFLLVQHSWHNLFAHRAAADCWALFQLLKCSGSIDHDTPRAHLQRLLETSAQPTVRVSATGAPYAVKDQLKAASYHWCPNDKVWSVEVPEDKVAIHRDLLRSLGVHAPKLRTITARERHRPLKPNAAQLIENRRRFEAPDDDAPW